jgi:hypothetical protein
VGGGPVDTDYDDNEWGSQCIAIENYLNSCYLNLLREEKDTGMRLTNKIAKKGSNNYLPIQQSYEID